MRRYSRYQLSQLKFFINMGVILLMIFIALKTKSMNGYLLMLITGIFYAASYIYSDYEKTNTDHALLSASLFNLFMLNCVYYMVTDIDYLAIINLGTHKRWYIFDDVIFLIIMTIIISHSIYEIAVYSVRSDLRKRDLHRFIYLNRLFQLSFLFLLPVGYLNFELFNILYFVFLAFIILYSLFLFWKYDVLLSILSK